MSFEDEAGPDTLATPARRGGGGDLVDGPTAVVKGYLFGEVIGRGGMGEVVLAHDLRIGRDVAFKRLRTHAPSADEVTRFLREARIQGRLDHPAIPPVYEVGEDSEGRPFFSMRRLDGATLRDTLAAPGTNRQRLLRSFAEVCMAIEFAHSRGVVHRDLKPSNIMIGSFGDVYVLDWGLARVVGEAIAEVVTADIDSLNLRVGDVLGTPGYMAPEQLHHAAEAGRPADIYALGSILFEILAGEPLHPRGANALPSTLAGDVVTSPAKRRPDRAVPPELDSLCVAMVALEPTSRPTARRVAERITGYLDGDRDVARRTAIAVDLVWTARSAYNEGRRADAMAAGGRALALDPESTEAAELVTTLILEPPPTPPAELEAAYAEADAERVRGHARTAVSAYLALASFFPILVFNGIRRWDVVAAAFGLTAILAIAARQIHRRPTRSLGHMLIYGVANVALLALLGRLVGPFSFVPALTCVVIMSVMAYPTFIARVWLLIAMVVVGYLVPIGLELLGVLGRTWEIRDGMLVSRAGALEVSGTGTIGVLIGASVATIVVAGVHASRIYRSSRQAQRQLVAQAWHLRQLLPPSGATRAITASGSFPKASLENAPR